MYNEEAVGEIGQEVNKGLREANRSSNNVYLHATRNMKAFPAPCSYLNF